MRRAVILEFENVQGQIQADDPWFMSPQFNSYPMISAAIDPEFGQITVSERNVGFLGLETAPGFAN